MESSLLIKETVSNIIIFHGLVSVELDTLIDKLETRSFQKGEVICNEGEMGREMFVIVTGRIEVLKKGTDGADHKLIELKDQDSFGEMTLIDIQPRSATIKAIADTTVAALSNKGLFDIYMAHPELYAKIILNIAREFSRRLRSMDERFVEFSQLVK